MLQASLKHSHIKRPLPLKLYNYLFKSRQCSSASLIAEIEALAYKKCQPNTPLGRDYIQGLKALVISALEEGNLNASGRLLLREFCINNLVSRISINNANHNNALASETIESPFIIVGTARSGTTLLHHLLSGDMNNRFINGWEALLPMPTTKLQSEKSRYIAAKAMMRLTDYMAPMAAKIHPTGVDLPQECNVIHDSIFHCHNASMIFNAPAYQHWLTQQNWHQRIKLHKQVLQGLQQEKEKKRWVLKSPFYPSGLTELFEHYPDGCFIFTHRSPAEIISSFCSLTLAYRQLSTDDIDLKQLGQQMLKLIAHDLNHASERLNQLEKKGMQIYHLFYDDFIADKKTSILKIYNFFDINFNNEISLRLDEYLGNNNHKEPYHHLHELSQFGLSNTDVELAIKPYLQYVNELKIKKNVVLNSKQVSSHEQALVVNA